MTPTDPSVAIDRDTELLERAADVAEAMRVQVEKRIVGQHEVIDEMRMHSEVELEGREEGEGSVYAKLVSAKQPQVTCEPSAIDPYHAT